MSARVRRHAVPLSTRCSLRQACKLAQENHGNTVVRVKKLTRPPLSTVELIPYTWTKRRRRSPSPGTPSATGGPTNARNIHGTVGEAMKNGSLLGHKLNPSKNGVEPFFYCSLSCIWFCCNLEGVLQAWGSSRVPAKAANLAIGSDLLLLLIRTNRFYHSRELEVLEFQSSSLSRRRSTFPQALAHLAPTGRRRLSEQAFRGPASVRRGGKVLVPAVVPAVFRAATTPPGIFVPSQSLRESHPKRTRIDSV